jgi:hypothetical protein
MRGHLDPAIVEFIESGEVSLYVAGRDAQLRPRAARAFGCRVGPDTDDVTTWVSRLGAPALLEDISSNGRLAFVVSHVETCRTFQLKSVNAEVAPVDADDYARIAAYHDAFIEQTMRIGYPEAMLRSMMQYRLDDLAAIVFTPSAAFAQTPGPGAGAPLAGNAPP